MRRISTGTPAVRAYWDMQISPIYVPSGVGGQPTLLDASNDGRVYAFDASTGKLDWQTPVGKHDGHDNDDKLAFEHKLKMFKFPTRSYPGPAGGSGDEHGRVERRRLRAGRRSVLDLRELGKTYPVSQPPLAGTGDMVALSVARARSSGITSSATAPTATLR
jgi:alcohol dehydrogenase (cytochrome c)